jgi:hypothetical protein
MKKFMYSAITVVTIVLLAALVVLPVSGMVSPTNAAPAQAVTTNAVTTNASAANAVTTSAAPTNNAEKSSPAATGGLSAKPFISATVSSATPSVGDPVTISGVATGGNLKSGVRIWLFAGNYVNVTTVMVNAEGTFTKTYLTTGLPPATIYVFVQSPSTDGTFDIDLYDADIYSGQVVSTKTKATIFNFTGTGSMQDAAASKALSDALNQPGQDDIYTKLTFQLTAPGTTPGAGTPAATPATPANPSSAPTTKSPLPLEVTAGALLIGCCAVFCKRKTH